jgi:hypothetical protein
MQSVLLAVELSQSLEVPYHAYDPRLDRREAARLDDNRMHSDVEHYYNDERNAALPKLLIVFLERQVHEETMFNYPHTQLPGTNLYLQHLRVRQLPDDLADLHNPAHPHSNWQRFIELGFEIISMNMEDHSIRQMVALYSTPIHLEVIPHSAQYLDHIEAPHLRFYAAIRQLIEMCLSDLINLCRIVGPSISSPIRVEYIRAKQVRDQWTADNCFPHTYLDAPPSLPLCYPPDHVHFESGHHPFMHKFEVKFLDRMATRLEHQEGTEAYKRLRAFIKELTAIQSPHQSNLSWHFLSGVFTKIAPVDIFEDADSHPFLDPPQYDTPDGFRSGDDDY